MGQRRPAAPSGRPGPARRERAVRRVLRAARLPGGAGAAGHGEARLAADGRPCGSCAGSSTGCSAPRRQTQPWLFWHDIAALEEASRELFDGYPFGETISTVGSALLTWRTRPIDGVVAVAPRGCGTGTDRRGAPAAAAATSRRSTSTTTATRSKQERLAGFAWRLRSRPPRADGRRGRAPADARQRAGGASPVRGRRPRASRTPPPRVAQPASASAGRKAQGPSCT